MSDGRATERQLEEYRNRYKCTNGDGGWCNGTKRGSRMRCPQHALCGDGSRVCAHSIEQGLDEMMVTEIEQ